MNKFFLNTSLNGLFTHTLTNLLVAVNGILLGVATLNYYLNSIIFSNSVIGFDVLPFELVSGLLLINTLFIAVHTYYGFENIILDYVHNIKVRALFLAFMSILVIISLL